MYFGSLNWWIKLCTLTIVKYNSGTGQGQGQSGKSGTVPGVLGQLGIMCWCESFWGTSGYHSTWILIGLRIWARVGSLFHPQSGYDTLGPAILSTIEKLILFSECWDIINSFQDRLSYSARKGRNWPYNTKTKCENTTVIVCMVAKNSPPPPPPPLFRIDFAGASSTVQSLEVSAIQVL